MEITIGQDFAERLERAKAAAWKAGIEMEGDLRSGTFGGMGVGGNYSVDGETLSVTVTDKPFFFPEEMIHAKIRQFFE